MKKAKMALIATAAVLCFACGGKTEVDFSIVPIKGANGEYQYIDLAQRGKIAINPQFSRAHIFRGGLALVKASGEDGKWGYIDKKGKFAIAPVYSKAQDFSDGVAWAQIEDQPPMLIDKNGKIVLQIDSLTAAYPFINGTAGVKVYSQGQELMMFIDKKGESIAATATEEEGIPVLKDGLYAFQDKGTKKWGYKNQKGETAIYAQFDRVDVFLDGMATTLNGTKWGAIDKEGNFVIDPQYDSLGYDGNGLFFAKVGKKWGWVNKKNEIVINPQFDLAMGFNGNKLSAVMMGKKWGYIDREGQIAINPQFEIALPFSDDYAMVGNDDNKIGFIDKKGSFVVPPLYEVNKNDSLEYVLEYILAIKQNLSNASQNGHFYAYAKLQEKKEKERERAIAKASGSLTDSRDNKTYKTIKIGTQTWMAENLNYIGDGYLGLCYGDKPREQIRNLENCEKYGRLYDWSESMGLDRGYNRNKFDSEEKVQGVCPSGWHLPSKEEWQILVDFAGGNKTAKKLKARSEWNKDGNGTDDYGFAALPGGYSFSDSYEGIGDKGIWWASTEYNASYAYDRSIVNGDSEVSRYGHKNYDYSMAKNNMLSVRCVKDD